MKISKQLFKEYVKECLIEILTEGLSKTELNESIKKNSSVVIGSSDKPRTQQRDVESGKVNELVISLQYIIQNSVNSIRFIENSVNFTL